MAFRNSDVPSKKRDPRWWAILALLNILVIEYPAGLYLHSYDDTSRLTAAAALVGVGFVLLIADLVTVIAA